MPPTRLPAMLFMGSCSRTLQAKAERLQRQTAVVVRLMKASPPLHGREAGVGQCGDVQWLVQIVRFDDRMIIEMLRFKTDAAAGQGVQEYGHHA